jgi:protein involved in polysaccharide export with SLBB domain
MLPLLRGGLDPDGYSDLSFLSSPERSSWRVDGGCGARLESEISGVTGADAEEGARELRFKRENGKGGGTLRCPGVVLLILLGGAAAPCVSLAQENRPTSISQSRPNGQSQAPGLQNQPQAQTLAIWSPSFNLGNSDPLAALNLAQVAASSSQIRTVLSEDPGLMIELKQLLALQATERGQLLTPEDLTDQAVYDKLASDLKFRSVCTRLLQRYGYLLPSVNPKSELGQERQILIQQRALQVARLEQQPGMTAPQPSTEAADICNLQINPNCPPAQSIYGFPSQRYPSSTPPINAYPAPPARPLPNAPAPSTGLQREILTSLPGEAGTGSVLGSLAAPGQGGTTSGLVEQTGLGLKGLGGMGGLDGAGGLGGATSLGASDGLRRGSGLTQQFPELPYPSGPASQALTIAGAQPAIYSPLHSPGSSGYPPESVYGPYGWSARRPYRERSPDLVPRQNPFAEIPSLYDMYMQAAPQTTRPERFGMQVFRDTTPSDQIIPMDLPVGPNYIVGPGDGLTIDLWGGTSERLVRIVDRTGRVALPEVGPVLVSGETLGQAQQQIQQLLRTQFRDISADVSVTRLRTVRVYVVGDVGYPGAYDVSSLSTPLNAEFAAGGPTQNGSLRVLQHWRDGKLLQAVDIYGLLLHGVTGNIIPLADGDTVRVPTVGPQVTVEGMLRRPDIYELRNEKTLADVIDLAGGILPAATLKHIEVQRLVAHRERTMLSLNIPDTASPAAVEKELAAFRIQDGDIVHVFPMASYNRDAVYLEGHVLRPGKYAYHQDMRLADLISSYKDLLPQPSDYAEIIRLLPPDFNPVVESFNLAEALKNPAKSPELDPLDTVRIFGRYDLQDVPTVSVGGAVREPGIYRTSGRIHLRDAIELAGGVTPDANMGSVQVFHYLPNSEMKVLSISLAMVMANSPSADLLLGSRDSVLVHENLSRIDPATVYVEGQVAHPGRYPLAVGMHISDLIHIAGGLTRSADERSADLTRYDWNSRGQIFGQQVEVRLASALEGTPSTDLSLRNGDVLTVRQVEGWNELGASIEIRGEVRHPGRYGIRPGETLSSVLEQAGGFTNQAYPYGALLERKEVRRIQMKTYEDLISRVRRSQDDLQTKLTNVSDHDQKVALQTGFQQWQTTLQTLVDNPPVGRVVIHISRYIRGWAHSTEDIELRAGDVLVMPKKPSYILVQGQVYNPTALSFRPGRSARWYLGQAGGATNLANKKAIFVIRADGSVVGAQQGFSLWRGNPLDATLYPGDTVAVPEKPVTGPPQWKSVFQSAQVISSIVTSAVLVAHYY